MSIPTPEQAQELVGFFGSQQKAANATGVSRGSIQYWLDPEAKNVLTRAYYAAHRKEHNAWTRAHYQQNREARCAQSRALHRKSYYARKDAGLCVACGQPGLSEIYCLDCLTKHTVYG